MQISCNWHVRFVEFGCSDVTNHKGAKGDSQYKLVFSPTTPRRNTGQKRSIPDDNTFTRKLFPKTMIAQQWLEKNHVQHTFLENLSSNWLFLAFNSHGCNGLYFRRSHVCILTYTYIYIVIHILLSYEHECGKPCPYIATLLALMLSCLHVDQVKSVKECVATSIRYYTMTICLKRIQKFTTSDSTS